MNHSPHKETLAPLVSAYLSIPNRVPPVRKLRRLRIAWFILGSLFGFLLAYTLLTFVVHPDYSRHNVPSPVYAKTDTQLVSYQQVTAKPSPPPKTQNIKPLLNSHPVNKKTGKVAIIRGYGHAGGIIRSSLYQTATKAGLPPRMIAEIISALSYDVDLQRDIHNGNVLDVVFERMHTDKDVTTSFGSIYYISLVLDDRQIVLYHHTTKDGFSGYYTSKGESVKKALLRTPINGAHITSGFGMRMHPLLGYSKFHKGIDFGAVMGTPIYAAGDGIVEEAGRKGGYGNYVRLRHTSNYATAYAHASRIAKGVKVGAKVKQGQVIAYVGSTGSSTGPHLHYEILANGTQVNPAGVKFRTGNTLQGKELALFKSNVKKIDTALAMIPRKVQVAVRD